MKIGVTERGDAGLDHEWLSQEDLVDGIILITKAPQLLKSAPISERTVIHCTITGYGQTIIEPNVLPWKHTVEVYHKLVEKYGGERIVLRVDPVIPTMEGFNLAKEVVSQAKGRVRISFLDLYWHVRKRFSEVGIEFKWKGTHAPLAIRISMWEALGKPEICGEPDMPCTGCVSARDIAAMELNPADLSGFESQQRKICACIAEKKELLKRCSPCWHDCLYCYWMKKSEEK